MNDELTFALREAWGWTGLRPAAVTAISPFGHLVIRDEVGSYWYLDPELRLLEKVGDTEEAVFAYMNDPEVKEVWLADNRVAQAQGRLGAPPAGSCYSLTPHALLAGDYSPENLRIVPIAELVHFTGSVEKQTQHLPDGATIELKVVE